MGRAILIAAVVLAAAACGGEDEVPSQANAAVAELLIAQGAPAEQAPCFASELAQYSTADLEEFFAAESAEDLDPGIAEDFASAAEVCEAGEAGETPTDSDATASAPPPDVPPPAALPDHVEAGNPLDDSFPLDVQGTNGFGTNTSSCTQTFVAASGLDASLADCINVTSAVSNWVAVVATVPSGHELWMACSDGDGGYTFGLRWAGTVQGITPMDDDAIGSGLIVSLVDQASVIYHVVIRDQFEGSLCPTSTVEFPGTAGTGPVPQAGGVFMSIDDTKGVCYRPVDGVWTRGTTETRAC